MSFPTTQAKVSHFLKFNGNETTEGPLGEGQEEGNAHYGTQVVSQAGRWCRAGVRSMTSGVPLPPPTLLVVTCPGR